MKGKTNTVERIDLIFQTLFKTKTPMSAAQIQKATSLPKTTLSRILQSLYKLHYIHKAKNKYTLGRIDYFPPSITSYLMLTEIANIHMKRLCQKINETVKLNVLFNNKTKVILVHVGKTDMNVMVNVGTTFPLHAGAASKVLIAFNSYSVITHFLESAPYEKFTPSTIVTKNKMKKELIKIVQNGFAIDEQEYIYGIEAIAYPIFLKGYIIAAVSVPTLGKLKDEKIIIQQELAFTCKSINEELNTCE